MAQSLQLTDFVDDAAANLCSIYNDSAGNAGSYIQANGGKLMHVLRSGALWSHISPSHVDTELPPCMSAVNGWGDVALAFWS